LEVETITNNRTKSSPPFPGKLMWSIKGLTSPQGPTKIKLVNVSFHFSLESTPIDMASTDCCLFINSYSE